MSTPIDGGSEWYTARRALGDLRRMDFLNRERSRHLDRITALEDELALLRARIGALELAPLRVKRAPRVDLGWEGDSPWTR